MKNVALNVSRFLRGEKGLTMVEYAVAGALIAAVAAVGFATLGTNVNELANAFANAISSGGPSTGGGDPL